MEPAAVGEPRALVPDDRLVLAGTGDVTVLSEGCGRVGARVLAAANEPQIESQTA
jgi:hypothetical protein